MLLEMLMNNIGEPVHRQVIDNGLLPILVKIVKKKTDLPVREKIFLLLDATQTSLGGASAKFPQYYSAYYDLVVRMGIWTDDICMVSGGDVMHLPLTAVLCGGFGSFVGDGGGINGVMLVAVVSAGVQFPQRPCAISSDPPTSQENRNSSPGVELVSSKHEEVVQQASQVVPESRSKRVKT
ncbi:TOM1-like protein 5 [Vitis vinifera]|uniref:TOM1-like protein 5 n=1 Tax=Vitis vinifera TaxID=29760 RepID=A0A438KIU4_VITVI|nr:TOM1-like protein 5 [Vitis vinifera]